MTKEKCPYCGSRMAYCFMSDKVVIPTYLPEKRVDIKSTVGQMVEVANKAMEEE